MFQRGLRGDEDAADVDVDDAVEFIERGFFERLGDGRAGVVDEDVEPAEVGDGLVDGGFTAVGIGGVGLNGDRLSAGLSMA